MTRFTTTTTAIVALLATTTLATAGGVERQAQSPAILFEDGTYVELGFTTVNPDVSGVQQRTAGATSLAGSTSGDIAPSYNYATLSYRQDITEELSFALIYDQPIGADVNYMPNGGSGYLYGSGAGSQAEIRSQALTLAARYEFTDRISAYAGLRVVTAEGTVSLFNGSGAPAGSPNRYTMEAESDAELGFMIGAAYEIPDIALRVALTYYSETNHTFTGTEGIITPTGAVVTGPMEFETTIPQQVLLEAQTGVAEGTLVFGSIRWTEWTEFDIAPPAFNAATGGSLVDYDDDVWTYTIGGARVLNEQWTALASLTYEASQGGFSGNLGPTDGRTSVGLGARYTQGSMTVTGGINYTMVGDATTEAPGPFPAGLDFGEFADNSSLAFGLRVGFSF
ncbi:OmpP1/FadL family transporter [Jannaschia sp. CCS1]|uniref:OmpP1/FadL family transporter n=1 Tax=Jannaschia sp. (strain CCS1) TaxID=290400 RepID=UPI000053C575|nr:outer membrane protein transport protein [Jannaschia sp. CCS1]ABD55263.1 membrane protein involved in aromatic hydrocarbon degradation [Jannaschia sp. CCS1]